MPRKARIGASDALHHAIVRGTARRKIFDQDDERLFFLERFGTIISETETHFFAGALIPNHCHLLLITGAMPTAGVMKRLLTGYAI